jgi:hypothetical protein
MFSRRGQFGAGFPGTGVNKRKRCLSCHNPDLEVQIGVPHQALEEIERQYIGVGRGSADGGIF